MGVPTSRPRQPDHADDDPFEQGAKAALDRAARYDIFEERAAVEETVALTRDVVASAPEKFTHRFVELLAENVVVGAVARRHFHDEPLASEEIQDFMREQARMQNSWRHLI